MGGTITTRHSKVKEKKRSENYKQKKNEVPRGRTSTEAKERIKRYGEENRTACGKNENYGLMEEGQLDILAHLLFTNQNCRP